MNFIQRLGIQCIRGCDSPAVGVYWLNKGCACDHRRLQWLCAQHLVKLEPIDKMRCLLVIHPMTL